MELKKYPSVDLVGIGIHAVWSCPRLGFMDNFQCVYEVLPRLGIPLLRGAGAFWGQSLETSMDTILEQNEPDAILTMDYDSVFSMEDLVELIDLFKKCPDAAAVAAHQWSRTCDKPLWTVGKGGNDSYTKVGRKALAHDLMQVETAHFGMTLIRASVYRNLPRPRFMALPNTDGKWENGKIDDDIHFWKLLEKCGHKVYVAPKVAIGHVETVVTWPGKGMHGVKQNMLDFWRNGRPHDELLHGGTRRIKPSR